MELPVFEASILRRGETLVAQIEQTLRDPSQAAIHDMARAARMSLCSSATNDYYEKVGAEAIGFTHCPEKHGPDGKKDGQGAEVKPTKGSPGTGKLGVINDDSAMKLLKDHKECQWLVALKVASDGSQVSWALVAPFHYWEACRFQKIVKKLGLKDDPSWKWSDAYPDDTTEREQALQDLVAKHKKDHYVRSSELSLAVLEDIPREQVRLWVHPDLPKKKLHKLLKTF